MKKLAFLIFIIFIQSSLYGQQDTTARPAFWQPAPRLHPTRFWATTGGIVGGYSAVTVGLAKAWYSQYPRTRLHSFNDWNGWRQMDKMGHAFTTYFESKWVFGLYQWTGVRHHRAACMGAGAGMLFQSTLELLDGFSGGWGFSWGDMGFNTLGAGLFLSQQLAWREQRIRLKMSSHAPRYDRTPLQAINSQATTTIERRAANLFGTSLPEQFFKEYNGQTIWLSVNPASFTRKRPQWLPAWANIAVGYSIENVLGAERNSWTSAQGDIFVVSPAAYPRYSQYFLSLDIDFERIPTRKRWLKSIFGVLNVFKLPFPTLEYNSLGQWRGRWLYF